MYVCVDPNGEMIYTTAVVSNGLDAYYAGYEWTYEFGQWQFMNLLTWKPYGSDGYTSLFIDELKLFLEDLMSRPFGYSYISDIVALEEAVLINHSNSKMGNSYNEESGALIINNCALGGYKVSKGKFKNFYPKGLRNFK